MELPYPVAWPQAPLLDLERRSLVFRRARPWTTFHHYRSFQNLNQIVLRCALDPPSPDVLAWPLVLLAFDTAALRKAPHLRVLSQSGFSMGLLVYNVTHQPLDDMRVRRALDMAIDKKAIIDAVYDSHAQVAVAPMP